MMKVISIINLKGGVGKTFTSSNMAYELAARGYKVLLLDNDKQGNLSKAFKRYNADGIAPVAKLLTADWVQPADVIAKTDYENIDIIAANMHLMAATWQISADSATQYNRYKKFTAEISVCEYYDFMIIDNPPDIALNVINALAITNDVIVPVKMDEWALEGLEIVTEQLEQAKQINKDINLMGVLVTEYRNNDTNAAGLEWLDKKSNVTVLGKIRYSDKAAESTFFNLPVRLYSPRSSVARDYKNFVTNYIEERITNFYNKFTVKGE